MSDISLDFLNALTFSATACLNTCRSCNFPLVWITQAQTTVAPALHLCPLSKSTPILIALGCQIKRIVANKLVNNSHSTVDIDLLLGLLAFFDMASGHPLQELAQCLIPIRPACGDDSL
jgi:hypothetical protein